MVESKEYGGNIQTKAVVGTQTPTCCYTPFGESWEA